MTIQPQSAWASAYQPDLQDYYNKYQVDQTYPVANFWQQWVDGNTKGIESAAPFAGSVATTDKSALSPLIFPPTGTAATSALILANAWLSYMTALVWPTIAPVAPFSAITSIVTSPTGVAAAYATLLSGLIAEMTVLPPAATAWAEKSQAFATLFYTATLATGIQITGLGIGSPPPPLVIPLSPVQ